jgi:hypothetical protein
MRRLTLLLTILLVCGTAALGQTGKCDTNTLRGEYGVQITGTNVAPNGTVQTIIGLINITFDGEGSFTQVGNVKGSVLGWFSVDAPNAGTYTVNSDCTGESTHPGPGGIPMVNRFIIVDNGKEFRLMVVSPAPVMVSGVAKRK